MIGIRLTTLSAYVLHPNGLIEWMNRTVMSKVRALINESSLGHLFRKEVITNAADFHHSTVLAVLRLKTPLKRLMRKALDNSRLGIFGFSAYVHKPRKQRTKKLEERVEIGICMIPRYVLRRIYIPRSKTVVAPKDVSFCETVYQHQCTNNY